MDVIQKSHTVTNNSEFFKLVFRYQWYSYSFWVRLLMTGSPVAIKHALNADTIISHKEKISINGLLSKLPLKFLQITQPELSIDILNINSNRYSSSLITLSIDNSINVASWLRSHYVGNDIKPAFINLKTLELTGSSDKCDVTLFALTLPPTLTKFMARIYDSENIFKITKDKLPNLIVSNTLFRTSIIDAPECLKCVYHHIIDMNDTVEKVITESLKVVGKSVKMIIANNFGTLAYNSQLSNVTFNSVYLTHLAITNSNSRDVNIEILPETLICLEIKCRTLGSRYPPRVKHLTIKYSIRKYDILPESLEYLRCYTVGLGSILPLSLRCLGATYLHDMITLPPLEYIYIVDNDYRTEQILKVAVKSPVKLYMMGSAEIFKDHPRIKSVNWYCRGEFYRCNCNDDISSTKIKDTPSGSYECPCVKCIKFK